MAAEVPFGHADWKPSPTDPVGFAGQGNNWFPGATPPTTWSLGVDGKGQNIRWTVPIPGWTDAQPLVVGKRIIGVYSPHHVVCYDADTGKVLWRDELKLMTLPDRGELGKPVGPVPDPAKAAKLQLMFERGLAWTRLSCMNNLGKDTKLNDVNMASRLPLAQHSVEVLTSWKGDIQADFPQLIKPLEDTLAIVQCVVNKDWEAAQKFKGGTPYLGAPFWQAVGKLCRTRMDNNWLGSVSDVMSSPVSDGEIVAVSLGFGQVAAYELASGKRLWAWREPKHHPGSTSHCASPCLWKDLVLLPAAGKNNYASMLGIDKRSGVVHWETLENAKMGMPWGAPSSHGEHMSPHLMRLAGGKALLVSNRGNLVDPETGASLGQMPRTAAGNDNKVDGWGSGFVSSVNGTLYKGWGGDCSAPPINAWPLSLGADGKVAIAPGYPCLSGSGHGPFALNDRLLISTTFLDPATGKVLPAWIRKDMRLGQCSVAGRYLIDARSNRNRGATAKVGKPAVGNLTTVIWDLSDLNAIKEVSKNTLTIAGFTPDISAKIFPKAAELYPTAEMTYGHVNYQGIGFNFATDTAGITAHGSRLYLHSPAHLICIGER